MWSKTCETLAFFEDHPQWRGYKSQGILTVVSDFSGDNAFISGETLNLLNRRHVQFKILERSKALTGPMPGVKAILWIDKDAPTADQKAKSLAFVRQGGLLIAPTYWGPAGVKPTRRDPSIDYNVYNIGQGQMAVPDEGFQDPYQVALDSQLLVSRRNDLARLYNPATTNCHCSFDPVRKERLVQIVNYSTDSRHLRYLVGKHASPRGPVLELRNERFNYHQRRGRPTRNGFRTANDHSKLCAGNRGIAPMTTSCSRRKFLGALGATRRHAASSSAFVIG